MTYTPLEEKSLSSIGLSNPSFKGEADSSFLPTATFLYTLCFIAIVTAAFYRLIVVGALRLQASEETLRRSNDIFKKVVYGLLGSFSLFILLATLNSQFISGEIGLSVLKTSGSGGVGGSSPGNSPGGTGGSGGSSKCDNPDSVLSKTKSGNLCAGASCTALNGCNYKKYLPIIERETLNNPELRKMVIVTMCKESRADPNAKFQNENKTYDCGLMQINQKEPCPTNPDTASQESNLVEGIRIMKSKISAVKSYPVVPGVPALGNVFASYNCCANGTIPSQSSVDCTKEQGYPENFPKWACPINPGNSSFNMCSVKNYACDLVACLEQAI